MKVFFRTPTHFFLLLFCSCYYFQGTSAQISPIPTWEFTPATVHPTSSNYKSEQGATTYVQFASTESYGEVPQKVDEQKYYPYSNQHYRFLKVVPEGTPASECTPNTLYEVGQTLPNIQLPNQNGIPVNLTETRGKYTLVHFWASWCPTSMIKVPHYQTLYEKYGNVSFPDADGFEVYAISLDKKQEDWREATKENKLTWKYSTLDREMGMSAIEALNVDIIPASYFLDPNGVIIGKNMCESVLDYTLSKCTQLSKNNALASKPALQNQPTTKGKSSHFGVLTSYVETYQPTASMKTHHRVELGTFTTLAFQDFSHLQHLGKIYQEPSLTGGIRVLIGDFPDTTRATNAAKELISKGYYNAHIVTYRFHNRPMDEEQIAERKPANNGSTNLFNP